MKIQFKYFIIFSLSAVVFSACQNTNNQNAEKISVYDFDSAIIEYEISGSTNGMSETKIKGDKKSMITKTIATMMNGEQREYDLHTIQIGQDIYSINHQNKTAIVSDNPIFEKLKTMTKAERIEFLTKEATNSDPDQMPESTGKDEVLGIECDVYQNDFSETCLWQTIPLKHRYFMGENGINITTIATSIEIDVPIDESYFEIPADYQLTDLR